MPWQTPTLRQCREMVRDDITTSLQGAVVIGNTVLRVMADAMAGVGRLTLKYLDWLALQLMPDTAETVWLDRHGQIWLVNADGSLGRKQPVPATGTADFSGIPGTFVPAGTGLVAATGQNYETLEDGTLADQPVEIALHSLTPGQDGNLPPGTPLALTAPMAGVVAVSVVDLRGGTEVETDEQLRARVLARIRQPPMGGCAYDYEHWAMSIPSVTRAWTAPREMGMGTVTLRFMCDALRADQGGIPTQDDITVVRNYLDTVRPVAVRDFFVQAPVPEPINFNLSLGEDSLTLRSQVSASVDAMIKEKATPAHQINGELVAGTTIKESWISEAINRITNDFVLDMPGGDHPMPHNGAIGVLGTITYPIP